MQEIWLVEYSPKQDAIHIDTLENILAANRRNIISGAYPGYFPLYAAIEYEEAKDFANSFRDILDECAQETF